MTAARSTRRSRTTRRSRSHPAAERPQSKRPQKGQAAARRSTRRRSPETRLRRLVAGDRIFVLALVVLLLVLGAMAVSPLQSYTVAVDRVEGLATSRDRLEEEVERLEERKDRLQDPEHIEVVARSELGLVMPGEKAYVVADGQGEGDAERFHAHPAREAEPEDVAWYRRLGRWVADWLGLR